jgi:hypothetical protein
LSKGIGLDGDGLLLVTEYDFPSVESRFMLFGLFIVFALAILVVVSTGASLIGGISAGGRKMSGETAEEDIVNQIDRAISAGISGPKPPEVGAEAVSGLEDAGGEEPGEAVASIDAELEAADKAREAAASIEEVLEIAEKTDAVTDERPGRGGETAGVPAGPVEAEPGITERALPSVDAGVDEPPSVGEEVSGAAGKGRSNGEGKALENDGIIIKKS